MVQYLCAVSGHQFSLFDYFPYIYVANFLSFPFTKCPSFPRCSTSKFVKMLLKAKGLDTALP